MYTYVYIIYTERLRKENNFYLSFVHVIQSKKHLYVIIDGSFSGIKYENLKYILENRNYIETLRDKQFKEICSRTKLR